MPSRHVCVPFWHYFFWRTYNRDHYQRHSTAVLCTSMNGHLVSFIIMVFIVLWHNRLSTSRLAQCSSSAFITGFFDLNPHWPPSEGDYFRMYLLMESARDGVPPCHSSAWSLPRPDLSSAGPSLGPMISVYVPSPSPPSSASVERTGWLC